MYVGFALVALIARFTPTQEVSNAVTKYGGCVKAMNKEKFKTWCDTAERTFPTGSYVWEFKYDEETKVDLTYN